MRIIKEEVVWTKDLSVKNGVIDGQHQQCISKISELIDAVEKNLGETKLRSILDFLESYMWTHLDYEEEYMEKNKYDKIHSHKIHHKTLKDTIFYFDEKLEKKGPTKELADELKEDLGIWFISHIKTQDEDYARFIKNRP
jgi:hemerythrin